MSVTKFALLFGLLMPVYAFLPYGLSGDNEKESGPRRDRDRYRDREPSVHVPWIESDKSAESDLISRKVSLRPDSGSDKTVGYKFLPDSAPTTRTTVISAPFLSYPYNGANKGSDNGLLGSGPTRSRFGPISEVPLISGLRSSERSSGSTSYFSNGNLYKSHQKTSTSTLSSPFNGSGQELRSPSPSPSPPPALSYATTSTASSASASSHYPDEEEEEERRPKEGISGGAVGSDANLVEGEQKSFTSYLYLRHPAELQPNREATSRGRNGGSPSRGESSQLRPKQLEPLPLSSLSSLVRNGIYWSLQLERLIPKGFTEAEDLRWLEMINSSAAVKLSEGCGRMQNRLVLLSDGQMTCARHRQNNDQIQGDILSFLLARVLGISNLPPATLSQVKPAGRDHLWEKVRPQLHLSQWNAEKPVVLTEYVHDLVPAFIPPSFRGDNRRLHPIPEDLFPNNASDLVELAQWSDLIVFDYLTANLDRVVNNLFNQQWNSEMMNSPAHNLVKVRKSGLLLFIDNESGLLHGYRLLNKYEPLHRTLLDSLCVFRKSTAEAIESLHRHGNVSQLLRRSLLEKVLDQDIRLPFLPERNVKLLNQRIATVYQQIAKCRAKYGLQTKPPTLTANS